MANHILRAGTSWPARGGGMEFEHKVGALDDEDLIVGDKEERNWKGLLIAILFIACILSAIVVAINLLSPNVDKDTNRMKLDFEHVVSDHFKVQHFTGSWLSDHEIVYVDGDGSIVVFDANSNRSSSMLVKTYDKTLHTMAGFKLSADRQSILFVSDVRHEFGAPVSARYAIFNISGQTVEFLDDLVRSNYPLKTPHIQYAAWGPVSNSIVFIESNDIYFIPDFAQRDTAKSPFLRLTKTGALSESITNGLPDSLYRSNIFIQANEATMWWSGDGRYLAYLSFDDALVEPTPIEYYDSYLHDSHNPKIHYERYPRAGAVNPQVTVHVVDLKAAQTGGSSGLPVDLELDSSVIQPPVELIKQQHSDPRLGHYITYVGWVTHETNELMVLWSNRAQNSTLLSICTDQNSEKSSGSGIFGGRSSSSSQWKCDLLATFTQRIPPSTDAKRTILTAFNSNGTRLTFFALPRPDSVIGDHYHVAMLRGEERAPKYLTHGEFDVDRLVSYDPISDTLYFEVKASENAERHLYKINSIGQIAARQTRCLTCALEEPCGYNYAHISNAFGQAKYLVHECFGPSIPQIRMRLLNDQSNLASLHLLGTNPEIENLIKSKQMPIERYIKLKKGSRLPYDVNIKLYLPNEIEDEKDKRFPLLIESSEIDRRNVWKKFDIDWGKYLASRKQLIYAKIDCVRHTSSKPMGSNGFSSSGSASGSGTYLAPGSSSLGYSTISGSVGGGYSSSMGGTDHEEQLLDSPLLNAKDQVEAIKILVENAEVVPYIDKHRIAIWGPTSTSAYVALATTINDDTRLIQCTVAISPITNWQYMSSYSAEHYLGLPWLDSNKLKYDLSNLLKRTSEFAMRKLLIIHGTADEQVHVQHSMQFIKSLTEHHITGGVIHQMQIYPDVGHSMEQVKKHYYLTLDGFIDRCFYQKPISIKPQAYLGKSRPKFY